MKRLNRKSGAMLLITAMTALGLSALSPAQPAQAAVQDTFYVSTTGSDTTGDGSASSPWATIGKARDYIESNSLNDDMTGDIDVLVAAGDYYVDSTITFDESDSGSNGFNVDYKNWGAVGSAHFIGGDKITGWTQYSGNIYRAAVPIGSNFQTLYENDTRAWKARYPNKAVNPAFPSAQDTYLSSDTGINNSHTVLTYKSGDLNPSAWGDLSNAQVYIWSGDYWDWFNDTDPIASVNTSTRQITLTQSTRYPIYQSAYHLDGSRYFIQGALALLDQPGEFYVDPAAGYVYYEAQDGAINSQTIIAPKVQQIVSLVGSSQTALVHNITFDGLSFADTDFTSWYRNAYVNAGDSGETHEYPQYDRQMDMPQDRIGMMFLENTDHVSILNSDFSGSGFSAIYMLFYNQNNLVSGNLMHDLGHSGVILEGEYPGEGDVLKNNVITNNLIHDIGQLVGNAAGVYVLDGSSNEVSYSEIYNSPRYAVAIDAYTGIPNADVYTRNNVVKDIKVHDATQDSGDTAPIYTWGVSPSSSAPYNTNYFSQITVDHSFASPSMTNYAPNGVFTDDGSYGQSFTNVKVTDTQGAAFHANSGPQTTSNVSWTGTFIDSAMDYPNIGVKSTFLYPLTPTGLSASATPSEIDLSWASVNNAVNYDVVRSSSAGGPFSTLVCGSVTVASCADTTVVAGATYYYEVKARTSAGLLGDPSKSVAQLFGNLVSDGFEGGMGAWSASKGSPATSTTQAHSGSSSFAVNQDMDVATHTFSSNQNAVVNLWFYDNTTPSTTQVFAKVDNALWSNGSSWRGIGVQTATSATKYVIRLDGTISATSVTRSTGWHKFTFDYSSGTHVDLSIDGTLVASPTGITNFNQISLGDWWGDSKISNNYFDDVSVTTVLDGFESGMGAWTASVGSPATSTAQAHTGSSSFAVNQDREVATHTFATNQNAVVKVWFYDNTAPSTTQVFAKVDNAVWSNGSSWRGIGVRTATSATKYVIRLDGVETATSVTRSTGWHEFAFDYSSGTHVDMSIDGTLVASPTGITSFNQISLGDWWANSDISNTYFDDVTIQ